MSPMKRQGGFMPCSKINQKKNNNSQTKPSKTRNIPSEIWLKRNILKKLTIQSKFNKSSTHQYRKFRQIFNDPKPNSQNQLESFTNTVLKQNQSLVLAPSKQTKMHKLSTANADNAAKITDHFFASNSFVKNGIKSYYHKSFICQRNNFINVSKAIILEKKNSEKNGNSKSYQKISQSQNHIQNQDLIERKQVILHKRPFSAHRSNKNQNLEKNTDFLKVTTKQLHSTNIDAFLMDCTRQSRKFYNKRSRTEKKFEQIIETSNQKAADIKSKYSFIRRPKSCVVKANKSFELTNCQGWVTLKGNNSPQYDELFFNILQL